MRNDNFPWLSVLLIVAAIAIGCVVYQRSQRSDVSVQVGPSRVDVQWPDGRVRIP